MKEIKNVSEQLTTEEKRRAAEIAQMVSHLSAEEQEKIYYMLMGSEIFSGGATQMIRTA